MRTAIRLSLVLVLVLVVACYAFLHGEVLRVSHPITQDEPGFVEITAAGNSYSQANMLACANVYGPVYPIFARVFTRMIENPYISHRWANTAALLITLTILAVTLRFESVGGLETACGIVLVYALNVSSHSLAASGDFLATALCVGALAAGRGGRWPGLVLCLVLSLAGGMTKLYATFAWFVVASHLLLFARPAKAVGFLAVSAAAALLCAVLLHRFAPAYFLSTFVVHAVAASSNFSFLCRQSAEFSLLTGGILGLALWRRPIARKILFTGNGIWLKPAVDFWDWAALSAAAVLLGKLGWHEGNHLVYFYHLLLVPLVIVALRRIKQRPLGGPVLLGINFLVLGWQLPPLPGNDHWRGLEHYATETRGAVLADPFFEPFVAGHPNIELVEHGQTASVLQALDWLGPAVPLAHVEAYHQLRRNAETMNARIRAEEFDALFLSYQSLPGRLAWVYDRERFADAVFDHYRPAGEVVFYPYCAPFWDRMLHGRHGFHVIKWVPLRIAGKHVPPPVVGLAPVRESDAPRKLLR